jgi:FkbM family methyltransferase
MLVQVLMILRRLIPASSRRRIRLLLFEWLGLDWELSTGLRIHLGAYGDWILYNEIFVSGEYDRAVAIALDDPAARGRPFHVVDLGASSGFFTLRAAHEARKRGIAAADLAVIAIEAHPVDAIRFRNRIGGQPGLAEHVEFIHGLVGELSGHGFLHTDEVHISSSTSMNRRGASDRPRPPGVNVRYVDLSSALARMDYIDLLKCDIEGSEQRFIENYRDVLEKVRVAVFEFHRDLCDVDRCQALLREYGFTHHATFRPGETYFTYGVWR